MRKLILMVTTHFIQGVASRIKREYDARRSPNGASARGTARSGMLALDNIEALLNGRLAPSLVTRTTG